MSRAASESAEQGKSRAARGAAAAHSAKERAASDFAERFWLCDVATEGSNMGEVSQKRPNRIASVI